jgi:DtxR family transcriptional regulator, Mn-dependent transcriptional regulator
MPALRFSVSPILVDRGDLFEALEANCEETIMSHERDLANQDIEEVAEELWTLGECGSDRLSDLRDATKVARLDAALAELARRNLARVQGDRVVLSAEGRGLAELQVRRHRLGETLFTTVLDVRDEDAVDRTACVMEHVLGDGLTDPICAFLGHPKFCPHGKPIPPGSCCRSLTRTVEPLVQPLDRLPVGARARIVYIVPREPERLVKLSNLGIVPGASIQLQQKSPAAVLRVNETTLAVDPAIAGEIYVKRAG